MTLFVRTGSLLYTLFIVFCYFATSDDQFDDYIIQNEKTRLYGITKRAFKRVVRLNTFLLQNLMVNSD